MNPLPLQGEFIKQCCVSLLGAVYFGVAEPGGKGRRNPSNLPSRPSKREKERGERRGGSRNFACAASAGSWWRKPESCRWETSRHVSGAPFALPQGHLHGFI